MPVAPTFVPFRGEDQFQLIGYVYSQDRSFPMLIHEVYVRVRCTMCTTRIVGPLDFGDHKHTPACYSLTTFLNTYPTTREPVPFSFCQTVEVIITLFRVRSWREDNKQHILASSVRHESMRFVLAGESEDEVYGNKRLPEDDLKKTFRMYCLQFHQQICDV